MYVVVLAGGGGTRLRPLSTPGRPKPFLPLLGPESLFVRTIRRLVSEPRPLCRLEDITVVAPAELEALVCRQAPGVAVLAEPVGRNTAAAIALAAAGIDRRPDEVMVVVPADHLIDDEARFRDVVAAAADLAGGAFGVATPLVTLGVEPTRPATEYGYLLPDVARVERLGSIEAAPLRAFEEKPDPDRATELVEMPGVAWNAGMFLWERRAILAALRAYAPDILAAIEAGLAEGPGALAGAYGRLRTTSIDYAVMEPAAQAGRVVMASLDVGWSDLGSWTALLAALGADGLTGTVLEAGAPIAATAADLVVRRVGGRLELLEGPLDGIVDPAGPVAILAGARAARPIVAALIDRTNEEDEG
jgi:mannose-1-phosphate guanylyltransferase/mannose-1-phosphate guanylyltransferase/mannose-6-phosphate isomerase